MRSNPVLITLLISLLAGLIQPQAAGAQPAPAAQPVTQAPPPGVTFVTSKQTNAFELRDGDRVVLLGDTFIERENNYGYLETRLTVQYPERNVTFRNLGWNADTPLGESRAGFDPPEKGFDRLKEQLALVKPTVAIIAYGMASSLAGGETGLTNFSAEYSKLLDLIQEVAGTNKVRFVLLSPIQHEKLPPPRPDPAAHHGTLSRYTRAIQDIADKRNCAFVNFYEMTGRLGSYGITNPITENGIHLNPYGYRVLADLLAMGLNWEPNIWRVSVLKDGKIREGSWGLQATNVVRSNDWIRFGARVEQLVSPSVTRSNVALRTPAEPGRLQFLGLAQSNYTLKIDGQTITTLSHFQWRYSMPITSGPDFDQAEELRQTIVKKNELCFHRDRPQHNTSLFRQQEQAQNAKEIAPFDPLIGELEQKIARLRKPVSRTFELIVAEPQQTNTPAPPKSARPPSAP